MPKSEFEIYDDRQLTQLRSIVYDSIRELPFDLIQFIIGEYLDTRKKCADCAFIKPAKDMQQCLRCDGMFCFDCSTTEYCDDCWIAIDSGNDDDGMDSDETEYDESEYDDS